MNRAWSWRVQAWGPPGIAAVATLLAFLWHGAGDPWMNDLVLQRAILRAMEDAWSRGESPWDVWMDASPFGVAVLRTYQHLPHVVLFLLRLASGTQGDSLAWWWTSAAVMQAGLPLGVTWGARRLGLGARAAAWAGAASSVLVEFGGYGLSLDSQMWNGPGLVTQAWGAVVMVPAAGAAVSWVRGGGTSLAVAVALASWCAACHPVTGVAAALLAACFTVSRKTSVPRVGTLVAALIPANLHLALPLWEDAALAHKSIHEPAWKMDGVGVDFMAQHFAAAHLLDGGSRVPWLGVAAAVGMAVAVVSRRHWPILAALLVFSVAMTGRAAWGSSAPTLLQAFHVHRMVVGVQATSVLLVGLGVAWLLNGRAAGLGWGVVLGAAVLLTADRAQRVVSSAKAHRAAQAAWDGEGARALVEELQRGPHVLVHPGMRSTWASETMMAPSVPMHAVTTAAGVPTLGMLYHAMTVASDVAFELDLSQPQTQRLMGVGRHVTRAGQTPSVPVGAGAKVGPWQLWDVPGEAGLDVVERVGVLPSTNPGTATWLRGWMHSPSAWRGGVLDMPAIRGDLPVLAELHVPAGPPGGLTFGARPNAAHAHARVTMERSGLVVLKTGFHPQWETRVDGWVRPSTRVTPGFVAVDVPPGIHDVEFRYRADQRAPWLLALSALTFAVLASRRRVA